MTDLAGPALVQLRSWHEHQNPLVRALTVSVVELVTATVTQMQAVIDQHADELPRLAAELQAQHVAALAVSTARMTAEYAIAFEANAGALQARHGAALQASATQLEALRAAHAAAQQANVAQATVLHAEHVAALRATTDRIDQLERHAYGPKSERRPNVPDARKAAQKRRRAELSKEEKEAHRKKASDARQARLDRLRTEVLDLSMTDAPPGRPLPALESVIYEWRAGELVRILVRREQRVLPDGQVLTAEPPSQVIEGGIYGPGLHAKVAMDKVLNAMPLHRQERAFQRLGAPLPVSALCTMFHRAASLVEPVYKALVALVGASEDVQADETPQPVLDKEHVRRAWMWTFATSHVIVYAYSPSRGGKVPKEILGESKGTLMVDGHTGYNIVTKEGGRSRAGCWSHGRRGLFDARGYDEALVDELLTDIGELFYVEQLALERQIVGTEEHLALRKARSAPVVARIYAVVELRVGDFEARSSLAKGLQYLLLQRAPLTLFLTNARVPLHNNLSERVLRVVALLRKNSYFVGHDDGGRSLAMLLSVAATCQLHDVDPEKWLADVVIRSSERGSTVDELMPWAWKSGRGATLSAETLNSS